MGPLHFCSCHVWFQGTPVYSSGLLFASLPSLYTPLIADTSVPSNTNPCFLYLLRLVRCTGLHLTQQRPENLLQAESWGWFVAVWAAPENACSIQLVTISLLSDLTT